LWLLGLATFSTILLIYASIVPLKYTPLDWDQTIDRWKQIQWLQLGVYNRADWIANALVVIPSAFFLSGAVDAGRRTRLPLILVSPLIVLFLAAVVLWIELVQVWFPPRTVSQNDIFAGWAGSLLGCIAWWLVGRPASHALESFIHLPSMLARVRWLLGALCFFSLAYTLYPFDFVVSWEELYEKKTLGRLSYSFSQTELISLAGVKGIIMAAAKVFPFGAWMGLTFSKRVPWLTITGIALALEAIQIPIYSKFATEWEAIAGIGGGTVGWMVARYWPTWITWFDRRWIWECLALAWSGLLVVFFNFRFSDVLRDENEIAQRWNDFWTPPLLRYYYTSEYSAISNLLGKIGMFIILGVCIHFAYWIRGSSQSMKRWFWLGAVWSILVGMIIEAGQIFLPPLIPDAFDIAIYASGFAIGFILSALICGERGASFKPISLNEVHPDRRSTGMVAVRRIAALVALTFVVLIWWHFPFAQYALGALALVYAFILWKWPSLSLPSIPSILACVNLMPFTGWIWVGELEIFVLIAFSIAILRYEIQPVDLFPSGVSRYLLAALGIVQLIGLMIGLIAPDYSFWESANPYLHPLNSWRATKGFWLALLFLPIIRYELRTDHATKNRFCVGLILAASFVALGGISERILYPGFVDFQSDYRIVSSWFDMHLGGSQIAIFLSLTSPAVLWFVITGRGFTIRFLSVIVLIGILYCLIISYARAAIVMTLLGCLLLAVFVVIASRNRATRVLSLSTRWGIPFAMVFGAIILAIGAWNIPFLRSRLSSILPDFDARLANWKTAFEPQEASSPIQWLLGHGSGCYPRTQFELNKDTAPSNLILKKEREDNVLRIESRSTLYVGQKITVDRTKPIHCEVKWRAKDGNGSVSFGLCEKVILYSLDCADIKSQTWTDADGWRISKGEFQPGPSQSLASQIGWVPVDLAFSCSQPCQTIEIASVRLIDDQGTQLVTNPSFQQGLNRWYLSDDQHLGWRIENEFIASWFDGGVLRMLTVIGFFFWSLLKELRNSIHGVRISPFFATIHCLTMLSFVFDTPLQAPRLASLAYLLAFLSLESSPRGIE